MKAVIISHSDLAGGAAIAAHRLHRGLLAAGVDSHMLVRAKLSDDARVAPHEPAATGQEWLAGLNSHVTTKARAGVNNTTFSLPWPGEDLAAHPLVREADVINLHWVSHFVSPEGVRALLALGKPVVWTLHDERPFTGGCHYTAGCEGFLTACAACPQLQPEYQAIPAAALALSAGALQGLPPLTIVTPSRWLGHEAERSRLLGPCRVQVIPNSVDLDTFHPGDRAAARAELGLSADALVLMFGAYTLGERRKGFDLLAAALRSVLEDPQAAALHQQGRLVFAAYGKDESTLKKSGLPVRLLGDQPTPALMARTLRAANLIICPTREDNLPNVVMEAMACGVPVLSCNVGGVPDMITDREHGRLVPVEDGPALAAALLELVRDPSPLPHWGRQARLKCETAYPLVRQGRDYAALFSSLMPTAAVSPDEATLLPVQLHLLHALAEAQGRQAALLKEQNTALSAAAKTAASEAKAKPSAALALKFIEQQLKALRSQGGLSRWSPTAWALRKTRDFLRRIQG